MASAAVTDDELQEIFRARGCVTNSQAWDFAELARMLLGGVPATEVLERAKKQRDDGYE